MQLEYIKASSSVKPELIDTTSSKTTVYIRQNVVENTIAEDDGNEYTSYEYDEAQLTKAEYEEYLKELDVNTTLQTIENLKTENDSLTEQVNMLTDCILEMSETLYA